MGNKMQLGLLVHCELLNGFSRGVEGKAYEKFIFNLELVQYSLLKITELKLSVSNKKKCYYNLTYKLPYLFFVLLR